VSARPTVFALPPDHDPTSKRFFALAESLQGKLPGGKTERLQSLAATMACTFRPKPDAISSIEHVIPKALDAELTIDRVEHVLMQFKRTGHGLARKSGAVPDVSKTLLGRKGTAVTNDLEHEIVVSADESGIHDLFVVPRIEASWTRNGRVGRTAQGAGYI